MPELTVGNITFGESLKPGAFVEVERIIPDVSAAQLLTTEQVERKLQQAPAPRVTTEQMDRRIVKSEFYRIAATVTVCNITLDNGYSVRGESACVNPENYDRAIGEKYSYDDAYRKLWPLFGFLLAEDNFRKTK